VTKTCAICQTSQIQFLVGELNDVFDPGRIELTISAEQLDEITVQAKRVIVSAELERETFDLSENIAQASGSVLDAMKKMPGITVDSEGKVMLRGSDKVMILQHFTRTFMKLR